MDLAQCAVDKTLNAAGVLQKLKDGTIKLVFTPVPDALTRAPAPSGLGVWWHDRLNAWYCPGEFSITDKIWPDCSGSGNGATLSGSSFKTVGGAGNGATKDVPALTGTTFETISFSAFKIIKTDFTVCSVTRYTGRTNQGRILQASTNWLHGHFGGYAGVAFYVDGWKTYKHGANVSPNTNWAVFCGTNAGSQLKLANGVSVGTAHGGTGDASLWVNGGQYLNYPGNEKSDFAIAEVVVWGRGLTEDEMYRASFYLMDSRGIKAPTST